MKPIRVGQKLKILANVGEGRRIQVNARMDLFGLKLGVVVAPSWQYLGKIVVPHWEEMEKLLPHGVNRRQFQWKPQHLRWQLVSGVYHAYRQTWHILLKYGLDLSIGEKSAMQEAANLARELNLTVMGLAAPVDPNTLRKQTELAITKIAELLGQPRALSKREALLQLAALQSGTDSAGKVNPTVTAVRATVIHARLLERLEEEVMAIDPHIQLRQKALINMIQLAELHLEAVRHFVGLLLQSKGLVPVLDKNKRKVIETQCEYCAQQLATIDFNPYRTNCRLTAKDLRTVRDMLREGKVDSAGLSQIRKLLIKCQSALEIKTLQIELERIVFRLTRTVHRKSALPVATTVKGIQRILRGLRRIDESHFRHKVCTEAIEFLHGAIGLIQEEELTEKIRKQLIAASAVL